MQSLTNVIQVLNVSMLYQISNGAVAFGDDVILHSIDFEIRNTEKIAEDEILIQD